MSLQLDWGMDIRSQVGFVGNWVCNWMGLQCQFFSHVSFGRCGHHIKNFVVGDVGIYEGKLEGSHKS